MAGKLTRNRNRDRRRRLHLRQTWRRQLETPKFRQKRLDSSPSAGQAEWPNMRYALDQWWRMQVGWYVHWLLGWVVSWSDKMQAKLRNFFFSFQVAVILITMWIVGTLLDSLVRFLLRTFGQLLLCILLHAALIAYFLFGRGDQ